MNVPTRAAGITLSSPVSFARSRLRRFDELLPVRQSVVASVYLRPVFGVSPGDYLRLTEAERPVEPDEFVATRNRIVRQELIVDVTLAALGVVYRRNFGVLFVGSVSGDLKDDDPRLGILVSVELWYISWSRFSKDESFDRALSVRNANVADDESLDPLHLNSPARESSLPQLRLVDIVT
ncbi:hypothetical protein [Halorussus salinus]|uniref:hypothetical protein n=1 Tax=Halorussus salinus TaxID=1364935 RepID=UPI0010920567|nr:hypothetical protein [Halorussus salinus]